MGLGLRDSFVIDDVSVTYSVAGGDSTEMTVTVPGVKTGDWVFAQRPADSSTLVIENCRVSAADTVKMTVYNWSGSANSTTETVVFLIIRPERHGSAAEI